MRMPKKELYTYEDYLKLPEGAPYQLIGGKLVMSLSPSVRHQLTLVRLMMKLSGFVAERDLGLVLCAPVDVYFGERDVYQPDIIFVSAERMDIVEEDLINGPPDLVVEILSPSTAYYDLRSKFKVYERSGVKEYWIVDPEERGIEVYLNEGGKFKLMGKAEGEGEIASPRGV